MLASSKLWSFFLRFQISSNGDTQIYSVFSCASGVPTLTRCENSLPMPQDRVYSLIMLIRMKCGMTICWFSCSLDHTESIFVCVQVVFFFLYLLTSSNGFSVDDVIYATFLFDDSNRTKSDSSKETLQTYNHIVWFQLAPSLVGSGFRFIVVPAV